MTERNFCPRNFWFEKFLWGVANLWREITRAVASIGLETLFMKRALIAAVLVACATSSAMANGIDDLAGCREAANLKTTAPNDLRAGYCMGVVAGLMMMMPAVGGIVCLPKGVTLGQGTKVLVKYMDDHPEELHNRTAELAARAFVKAWPCSR
jgi:hypothetical protein